jgi:hypothetical protein
MELLHGETLQQRLAGGRMMAWYNQVFCPNGRPLRAVFL